MFAGIRRAWAGLREGAATMRTVLAMRLGWTQPPDRGMYERLKAYDTSPWLRAGLQRIGESVANANWHLERLTLPAQKEEAAYNLDARAVRKYMERRAALSVGNRRQRERAWGFVRREMEAEEVVSHPLLRLLASPNECMQQVSLIALIQHYLDLVGETWTLMEPGPGPWPRALWPIPPTWITRRPLPGQPTVQLSAYGNVQDFPAELFLWGMHPKPSDPYERGSSIAGALSDDIDLDAYATKYGKAFYWNRAIPPVLITGKELAKDEGGVRRIEEQWSQKLSGIWDSFKPFFLNRDVQVHILSTAVKDMKIPEMRTGERDVFLQVLGFPPEILGIVENSNRATIGVAEDIYGRHVQDPRTDFIRGMIQAQLIDPRDPSLVLEVDSAVQGDMTHQKEVMALAPHAFDVDDWRKCAGLEPWGDDCGGDLVLVNPGAELVPRKTLPLLAGMPALPNPEADVAAEGANVAAADGAGEDDQAVEGA